MHRQSTWSPQHQPQWQMGWRTRGWGHHPHRSNGRRTHDLCNAPCKRLGCRYECREAKKDIQRTSSRILPVFPRPVLQGEFWRTTQIWKLWDHAIKLIPNAKSMLDCKVYPLNQNEQEQLNQNLELGRIHPSKSPFTSLFFFVKKKDGTLCPVQDYCKLNRMMIKNRYPLPPISELIDKLHSAKYFTKLDVCWGYNNVQIKEGDKEKATFRMNWGLFEPTIMFFGLTNSPATFQWMMNDIFCDLIAEGKVMIYLDDILIFSKDLEEHHQIIKQVLQRLHENKLFLKAEKCKFEVLETEYLRVIISKNSIRMDPVKIAGIAEWPTPTKKWELQSFLGFTNFYRKFIKNYLKVLKALTTLTGNMEWKVGIRSGSSFRRTDSLGC